MGHLQKQYLKIQGESAKYHMQNSHGIPTCSSSESKVTLVLTNAETTTECKEYADVILRLDRAKFKLLALLIEGNGPEVLFGDARSCH